MAVARHHVAPVNVQPASMVALASHNQARAASSLARQVGTEEAARTILRDHGGPLGYRKLQAELKARGHASTDREAMRFVREFKQLANESESYA